MNRNLSFIFISFLVALMASLLGCATPADEQGETSTLSGPAFVLFYTDN